MATGPTCISWEWSLHNIIAMHALKVFVGFLEKLLRKNVRKVLRKQNFISRSLTQIQVDDLVINSTNDLGLRIK